MSDFLQELRHAYPGKAKLLDSISLDRSEGMEGFSYDPRERRLRFGDIPSACRGLGYVLTDAESAAEGKSGFAGRGLMYDMSRNAVFTLDTLKETIRRMALSGFNWLMLYTEDTYRLEGEDYFGYLRGAYSGEELQAVNEYAGLFDIEVTGCIQTLGHLEQILAWPAYRDIKDTSTVLCIDEEKSYALIEKMVLRMKEVFSSDRIHIGMDEAHDFGTGRFLEKYGFQDSFDVITRHLNRVCDICRKHGLQPMMWSDMFFRIGSENHDYYDLNSNIPDYARQRIPEDVTLVYWDYYHEDKAVYDTMLDKHRDMSPRTAMASGIWCWLRFWYDHRKTMDTLRPCLESCREKGIDDVLLTMWGDDGAYCDYDSVQSGVFLAGDEMFGATGNGAAGGGGAERFRALFGADIEAKLAASDISGNGMGPLEGGFEASSLLWDDPLLGKYWNCITARESEDFPRVLITWYDHLSRALEPYRRDRKMGDNRYIAELAAVLKEKASLRRDLLDIYRRGDRRGAGALARRAEAFAVRLGTLEQLFSENWLRRNKPFGLETMQIRFAGSALRHRELSRRLIKWETGEVERIEELDEPIPETPALPGHSYRALAVGSHAVN